MKKKNYTPAQIAKMRRIVAAYDARQHPRRAALKRTFGTMKRIGFYALVILGACTVATLCMLALAPGSTGTLTPTP